MVVLPPLIVTVTASKYDMANIPACSARSCSLMTSHVQEGSKVKQYWSSLKLHLTSSAPDCRSLNTATICVLYSGQVGCLPGVRLLERGFKSLVTFMDPSALRVTTMLLPVQGRPWSCCASVMIICSLLLDNLPV